MTFSADPGSDYVKSLSRAHQWLAKSLSVLPDLAGSREFRTQAHCAAGEQAELVELQGPAEVVGMRLRVLPGAEELLRYQVIEITIDGVASVRMPLVDLVGVSHPWPHAWFPMAGDWAAGIVHPYYHGGGRREPAVAAYFKLPIPFARKLRIDVRNRSSQLPVTFDCLLRVMPLDDVDHAARLCGTSQRLDLPAQGEATLFDAPAPGRVIGLSMFTTGHGRDWDWRRKSRLELTDANGVIARGAGLLPLAMQGASGNICFGSLCWNHNSLEPQGRCGAGRHFWLDPLPLRAGGQLRYLAAGRDGPTRAEVAVLWYQPHSEEPFRAPEVSADIEPLPPPTHGQPGKPAPGGWAAEAEAFAATAEATCGTARAATAGAKDAFASGGAYLAWNAECPGDALDLLAPMPPTHYVRLWLHRLLFPAGGVFSVALAAPGDTGPRLARAKTDADFRARRLGLARGRAVVDYYDFWPHRQAYRHEMPIMRNQAPGRLGRIRFICVTKRLESRGYLLAVDQLGLDPSPASPPGWHEFEAAAVIGSDAGAEAQPMAEGRADFFGWGGLDIDAAEPSRVDIALVHPLAGPPAAAVELRGIAESGEWSIALDGAARLRVSATKEAKGPSTWRLTFTQPRSLPMSLTLSARCESRRGRLLLDAWQFDSMRP